MLGEESRWVCCTCSVLQDGQPSPRFGKLSRRVVTSITLTYRVQKKQGFCSVSVLRQTFICFEKLIVQSVEHIDGKHDKTLEVWAAPVGKYKSLAWISLCLFSVQWSSAALAHLFLLCSLTVQQEFDCPVLFPWLGVRHLQHILTQKQCQYILYTVYKINTNLSLALRLSSMIPLFLITKCVSDILCVCVCVSVTAFKCVQLSQQFWCSSSFSLCFGWGSSLPFAFWLKIRAL